MKAAFLVLLLATNVMWFSSRVTGYGAAPGYRPPPLSHGADVAAASSWRGKWPDISGFYQLGARPYDPVSGSWLSCDPFWNTGDPSGYSAFRQNPLAYFDADGRLGKGLYQGWNSGASPAGSSGAFDAGYWLGGVLGGFHEGWEGGRQITANTFTFGASDAIGLTHSADYQGWEYTGSRVLSTVGRESLIGAATLGSYQLARAGAQGALYTYQGLQVVNAGRSGYAIGTGIDQVSQGNNWGYLNIGAGTLGMAGGLTMTAAAPELNALGASTRVTGPVTTHGLSAAKGGTTPLWRAVKPEELADIQNTGIFRNLGSAEGKYFSTTAEGAASYAKQAVTGFGDPPYTLIKTEVPNNLLPPALTVDRNVPAVVLPNNVLPSLKPQVLDYFPVPPP